MSISQRPQHIEARAQVDYSEGDAVIRAVHKQVVVTLVKRKSSYAILAKVKNKTSDLFSSAIITKLNAATLPVKTLTFDNVKEFAKHSSIDAALKYTIYSTDPITSWQQRSNEN